MLRIICGPTGAGKSGLATKLAAARGLTIISADSRQIYRGFDIGTAKPSKADRRQVPHVGIDVADPTERWSAARWADDAAGAIERLGVANVLVVGGTGLYLRALVEPLFNEIPLDPVRRAELAGEIERWPLEKLRSWTQRLDPARAHLGRTQLLRAIEVALLTGRRLSDLHESERRPPRYRADWLVVDPGEALQAQIGRRLDAMLAAGWQDEIRSLMRTVPDGAPAWKACGYRRLRDALDVAGATGDATIREGILIDTRQYAKRQRTWFRHQLPERGVTQVDPRAANADALVTHWWEARPANGPEDS
ncbi:MAG: tRNA (adenosine(37)-N6)-dimethylallyltransferase MiaA [Gemmatimonadetes bacterium]|nr:tRNA (adenosine(37)-N6)-dimethylallyltransferase MiaA [Gemmatimonadota bacterium]